MTIKLTKKETALLQEQKSHEELCIKKYSDYAQQAQDPELKQLFTSHASIEQQHLNTVNQLLNGQIPNTAQQGQQGGQQKQQAKPAAGQASQKTASEADAMLCTDMLMTEKYISGVYDTAIFECVDTNIRQTLNHIQKEEQQHGEELFKYLQSHGKYEVN